VHTAALAGFSREWGGMQDVKFGAGVLIGIAIGMLLVIWLLLRLIL
jgi:hypothetical protein